MANNKIPNRLGDYLKQLADKYKGAIPDNVYDALYDYKVEITD